MKTNITLRELILIVSLVAMVVVMVWAVPNALKTKQAVAEKDSVAIQYDSLLNRIDSLAPIHEEREQELERLKVQDSLKDAYYEKQILTSRVLSAVDKRKLLADRQKWFKQRFNMP
ncbi:MAG: hypothetical protein WCK31_04805 [bacterium]